MKRRLSDPRRWIDEKITKAVELIERYFKFELLDGSFLCWR